ncbi:TonB-dependent receptor [Reichenbachiella agarivorans]|uniref:TonB-dependent receptor n=1 Tax=Reichenbachiella agarivorans TaxID=2979464 RepID=A0ABY6CPH6_9BACT|nr:TonB-dependent receptor [Reichenbachiella agarivorans]UXP32418.1 TonB-dependent receptor [Reichenbachiella agarivorans]
MKYLSILAFLIVCGTVNGQSVNAIASQSQDSTLLQNVIRDIEQHTQLQFFYKDQWVSHVYVHGSIDYSGDVMSQFDALLSQTAITYYRQRDQVILLYNVEIITTPLITQRQDAGEPTDLEEVFFTREQKAKGLGLEETLITIGNRKQYEPNKRSVVAGYVREIGTDKPVPDAYVYIESPFVGTTTDEEGFFSLNVPNGKRNILIQSVNMKNTYRRLMVYSDGRLDVDMEVDVIALNAVTVSAEREANTKSPQMGMTKISPESLKIVPALLGEKDMVRVATTTAGVQYLGEGSAGINIRGGKADQNLFLFDGTPVYNTNHFFGFFSVFNSDALSGMELYKSAIPAEFGGRLSSVFDISSKEPNQEKISGVAGIGPVTSKIMLEGPTFKNGPTFMVGGRATYSDYVINKIKDSPLKNNEVTFYDLVGKLDYEINDKNTVTLSGYYSFDRFQLTSDTLLSYTDFSYANKLLSSNWRHVFSSKLLADFNVGISHYDYDIGYDVLPTQAFRIDYGVKENHASAKFDYYVNEKLNYKFGTEVKHTQVVPGVKNPTGSESLIEKDEVGQEQSLEIAPYFSALYSPNDRISVEGGIRYSIFNVLGPGQVNRYTEGEPVDIDFISKVDNYDKNEIIETYHGPEFRLSSRYSLNETNSVKASYNRTRQNIHLLLNSASIAPTDMWRLSNAHIKPQIADQVSVGYYRNFYGKHMVEASAELYYKHIQNLLDFKVGADLQFNKNIETDLLQGKGRSYGLELSLKKTSGWLTGWINYTYSRSLIQLDGDFPDEVINGGEYFPTGYDKPHYINSVTNYKFTRRLTMTLNVVYATGVPVTYPTGKYNFQGSESLLYSDRNAYRIPDYFRMDLGINIEGNHKIKKLAHSFWSFSIYNLLGRDNVYSVFFKVEDGEVKGYKMTVFPTPIPTITYNFTF